MHSLTLPQQQEEIVGAVLFLIRYGAQFVQQWSQPIIKWLLLLPVQRQFEDVESCKRLAMKPV